MGIASEELEARAREINDTVFGKDRKLKKNPIYFVKEQSDLCAKFALEKALSMHGISDASKIAFIGLLKEQPDAINLLFADSANKEKAIVMLKPIFGQNAGPFIDAFQTDFGKILKAAQEEMKRLGAA